MLRATVFEFRSHFVARRDLVARSRVGGILTIYFVLHVLLGIDEKEIEQ